MQRAAGSRMNLHPYLFSLYMCLSQFLSNLCLDKEKDQSSVHTQECEMEFCFKDVMMTFVDLYFVTLILSKWGFTFDTDPKDCFICY